MAGDRAKLALFAGFCMGAALVIASRSAERKENPNSKLTVGQDRKVIGDASLARDAQGDPLPGLAPVAKQQGSYVAQSILRQTRGEPAQAPFQYRDFGMLATIGRSAGLIVGNEGSLGLPQANRPAA